MGSVCRPSYVETPRAARTHARPQSAPRRRIRWRDRQLYAARWLRSVAPRAKIAARSDNWAAFLTTVKTGVGLAPLPIHHGDREKELVLLIDTEPRVVSQFWLLMHPDMRHTPRVRAFFDYVVAEVKTSDRCCCARRRH